MVRAVQLPDRHRVHPAVVSGKRIANRGAGVRIPHLHRAVALPETTMVRPVQLPDRHRAHARSRVSVNGSPIGAPVAASHTRTVPSSLPETTMVRAVQLPDRHRVHPAVVAGERVADRGAGGRVPYPHRPVAAAGDHDGAARPAARPPPRSPRRRGR